MNVTQFFDVASYKERRASVTLSLRWFWHSMLHFLGLFIDTYSKRCYMSQLVGRSGNYTYHLRRHSELYMLSV